MTFLTLYFFTSFLRLSVQNLCHNLLYCVIELTFYNNGTTRVVKSNGSSLRLESDS